MVLGLWEKSIVSNMFPSRSPCPRSSYTQVAKEGRRPQADLAPARGLVTTVDPVPN